MKKVLLILLILIPLRGFCQIINTVVNSSGIAGFSGDGDPCLTAQLNDAGYIVFDKYGNMYIVDNGNNRVRKINTSGIISEVAGNGAHAYGGDGTPATSAELDDATSVAVDKEGNVYIGTTEDMRIRKVNTAGIITTIAGNGTTGYNGDNIQATAAELNYPYLGAIDSAGNIYFSDDGNHRVRKISPSGMITTIAGNGTNTDSGDGGPATASTVKSPSFLSINSSGDLFIADDYGRRIRVINTLAIITTFAGGGTATPGDGGPATNAELTFPNGVAFNDSGDVYIADYGANVIRKVNSAGIISTMAETGTAGYSGDGGPAILAEMMPNTLAVDANGNLLIADPNNNRIRRIAYNTTAVNQINKTPKNATIYPNPAHNEVTIKTTDKIESIEILNLIGQEVYKQLYNNASSVEVDVSRFASGVYFVKVNGVYAGKFVKE